MDKETVSRQRADRWTAGKKYWAHTYVFHPFHTLALKGLLATIYSELYALKNSSDEFPFHFSLFFTFSLSRQRLPGKNICSNRVMSPLVEVRQNERCLCNLAICWQLERWSTQRAPKKSLLSTTLMWHSKKSKWNPLLSNTLRTHVDRNTRLIIRTMICYIQMCAQWSELFFSLQRAKPRHLVVSPHFETGLLVLLLLLLLWWPQWR